jgi:membrane associated rhomboid family serine protease
VILPVGHEHSEIRRVPVVFLGILLLNIAVHTAKVWIERPGLEREEAAREATFDYLAHHPYVTLDKAFVRWLVGAEEVESLNAWIERKRQGVTPPAEPVKAAEQDQIDRLCAEAVRAARERPQVGRKLGFDLARPTLWSAVTAMFTHENFWHIFGNMLFFYITAPFLEDVYGRALFLLLYLAGGLSGKLGLMMAFPDGQGHCIGASGAVSALLGAFLVRFATTRMRFVYILPPAIGTFSVRSFVVLPLFLARNVYDGLVQGEHADIAYWSHVGGFVFGLFLALTVRRLHLEERYIHPAIERATTYECNSLLGGGLDALAAGDPRRARPRLLRALAAAPDDPEVHLALYRTAVALDDHRLAARHAARHLEIELRAEKLDWPLAFYREVSADAPRVRLPASLLFHLVRLAERTADRRSAIEILERIGGGEGRDVEAAAKALGHAAAIRLRAGDSLAALEDLTRALRLPGLTPTTAREIDQRRRQLLAALHPPPPVLVRPPRRAPSPPRLTPRAAALADAGAAALYQRPGGRPS